MPINMSDGTAEAGLLCFMSARCDVSSQHKLPTINEVLETHTADMIGVERAKKIIEEMLADGRLIAYGPYISDRKHEVL